MLVDPESLKAKFATNNNIILSLPLELKVCVHLQSHRCKFINDNIGLLSTIVDRNSP